MEFDSIKNGVVGAKIQNFLDNKKIMQKSNLPNSVEMSSSSQQPMECDPQQQDMKIEKPCSICHMLTPDQDALKAQLDQSLLSGEDVSTTTNTNPPCSICQTRNYDYKLRFHRGGDVLCSKACFKIHTTAFLQQLREQRVREAETIPFNYHNVSSGGPCC